ncbi:MAG: hypothetical protein ACRDQ0_13290, partial [Pseudonocardia sp.]
MAAEWSSEVLADAERWVDAQGGEIAPGWVDLGVAVPRADGRLVLDLRRGRRAGAILDPCLSGEHGPEQERSYPVVELLDEDGVLVLHPPVGLPEGSRRLWARTTSPRSLLHGLT